MGRQVVGLVLRFAVAAVMIAVVDGYTPTGYAQPMTAVVLVVLGVGLMTGASEPLAERAIGSEAASAMEVPRGLGVTRMEASGDAKAMMG